MDAAFGSHGFLDTILNGCRISFSFLSPFLVANCQEVGGIIPDGNDLVRRKGAGITMLKRAIPRMMTGIAAMLLVVPMVLVGDMPAWADETSKDSTTAVESTPGTPSDNDEESSTPDTNNDADSSEGSDASDGESADSVTSDEAAGGTQSESTNNDETQSSDGTPVAPRAAKAKTSWSDITGFNNAYTKYASGLSGRLSSVCRAAGCKVAGLKDNGTISINSGYQGTYSADASGGIITTASDTTPQTATTYKFTVRPNYTGKFSIRNTSPVGGTRPSFIIAARGQFGKNGSPSDYVYAGYIGDQKNGVKVASAGNFSSWLNSSSRGDYFLGNKSAMLCATGRCQGGANTEGNWVYFNNGTKSAITVSVVLTAQGRTASGSAAKLNVAYMEFNNADAVPVYRVYNPKIHQHHYTVSRNEVNKCLRQGWRSEGVAFKAFKTGNHVYRLYNTKYRAHFFTLSNSEYVSLQKHGWRGEGIAFYTRANGLRDVYRMYNTYSKEHLYTSYGEYKSLIHSRDWRQEKIVWNAM
ncbi:hypothetical protein [Bifidobacterium catulorum]|uniref:hypothetical protein n=1 Tax=Bifidobacterium catulorum TaxID=1630173 RepID=UPI001304E803|nr:hypothetical protein [Bifidobacterium catulorum]